MTVSQYLDFNMFRIDDAFLHEHFCRAEGLSGFRDHSGELLSELFLVVAPSNASAATARSGLDHHRIADAAGDRDRLVAAAGNAVGGLAQAELVDERGKPLAVFGKVDRVGAGAQDRDARILKRLREMEADLDKDAKKKLPF